MDARSIEEAVRQTDGNMVLVWFYWKLGLAATQARSKSTSWRASETSVKAWLAKLKGINTPSGLVLLGIGLGGRAGPYNVHPQDV